MKVLDDHLVRFDRYSLLPHPRSAGILEGQKTGAAQNYFFGYHCDPIGS